MAQANIVQLPRQLQGTDYECSRECIVPEACTTPCVQRPSQTICEKSHVDACCDNASCALPHPEPHQNIAKLTGAKNAICSQLYVRCPLLCNRKIHVADIKLAKEGRNREIWNCSHCRKIKKKQVKVAWYHFVCLRCTHTHGSTCLIKRCTSNCPTRKALESLKVTSKIERLSKAVERLKETDLMERLTVLKTAWILGGGRMPQPWCRNYVYAVNYNRKHLMSMLHSGFRAITAKRSVRLPEGFCDDIGDNFQFDNCMTKLQEESTANRIGFVFKYKNEFYKDVKDFCKNYNGLKNSAATAEVINTNFPNSAYLVIPGRSMNNYRHIPAEWKNGKKDLSTLKGAAYILGNKEKPARPYLLLVSMTELQRAAAAAIIATERRKLSAFIKRNRAAKMRQGNLHAKNMSRDKHQ